MPCVRLSMLNIFENYSTYQSGIDCSTEINLDNYEEYIENADAIFIVWGVNNKQYAEQKERVLSVLKRYSDKLFCIKNSNGNFPAHPRRMEYDKFSVIRYEI